MIYKSNEEKISIDLPQDYGDHLNTTSNIDPINSILPSGSSLLQFDQMNSIQFEQFCWWLINKKYGVEGCYRIGEMGSLSQEGIDLFAYSNQDKLVVFECKCYKNNRITKNDIKKAVDRFIDGKWSGVASEFVLIVAQYDIKNLVEFWSEQKAILKSLNIDADLWTGVHLTEKVQAYPSILTKFFPGVDHSIFANRWMVRENFIETLHKTYKDPRLDIKKIAQSYLEESGESFDEMFQNDISWSINSLEFNLYCLLPNMEVNRYTGSLSISIINDVTIVLNQHWLLNNLFGAKGLPIEHDYRPFIVNIYEGKYILDLANCRLYLDIAIVEKLIEHIDNLSDKYLSTLRLLEQKLGAVNYPFVSSEGEVKVLIGFISINLWRLIVAFTEKYDFANGNTEWHIFYKNKYLLLPMNKDNSFSTKITMRESSEYGDGIVELLWHPPSDNNSIYWDCDATYTWLTKELFPAIAKDHISNRRFILNKNKRIENLLSYWKINKLYQSAKYVDIMDSQKYLQLQTVVEILQAFFNSLGGSRRYFFTQDKLTRLLKIVSLLLDGNKGYLGYVLNKLSFSIHDHQIKTRSELKEYIDQAIKQYDSKIRCSHFMVDNTLRAILELIGNDDLWISNSNKHLMFEYLECYMNFYNQEMLKKRHSMSC